VRRDGLVQRRIDVAGPGLRVVTRRGSVILTSPLSYPRNSVVVAFYPLYPVGRHNH